MSKQGMSWNAAVYNEKEKLEMRKFSKAIYNLPSNTLMDMLIEETRSEYAELIRLELSDRR
jgi:hypothetical protein